MSGGVREQIYTIAIGHPAEVSSCIGFLFLTCLSHRLSFKLSIWKNKSLCNLFFLLSNLFVCFMVRNLRIKCHFNIQKLFRSVWRLYFVVLASLWQCIVWENISILILKVAQSIGTLYVTFHPPFLYTKYLASLHSHPWCLVFWPQQTVTLQLVVLPGNMTFGRGTGDTSSASSRDLSFSIAVLEHLYFLQSLICSAGYWKMNNTLRGRGGTTYDIYYDWLKCLIGPALQNFECS